MKKLILFASTILSLSGCLEGPARPSNAVTESAEVWLPYVERFRGATPPTSSAMSIFWSGNTKHPAYPATDTVEFKQTYGEEFVYVDSQAEIEAELTKAQSLQKTKIIFILRKNISLTKDLEISISRVAFEKANFNAAPSPAIDFNGFSINLKTEAEDKRPCFVHGAPDIEYSQNIFFGSLQYINAKINTVAGNASLFFFAKSFQGRLEVDFQQTDSAIAFTYEAPKLSTFVNAGSEAGVTLYGIRGLAEDFDFLSPPTMQTNILSSAMEINGSLADTCLDYDTLLMNEPGLLTRLSEITPKRNSQNCRWVRDRYWEKTNCEEVQK